MFDADTPLDEKLETLRGDFEACVDHQAEAQEEAHRAARFYHNTNNEGQWESDDLAYLREHGRVAFTFNVLKPTIDTFIGQVRDQQRTAKVEPVGGDDVLLADILQSVSERIEDQCDQDALFAATLKNGVIHREASLRIHASVDPDRPEYTKLELVPVSCFELHYDPASSRVDRADARYLFWDRWLSRSEFEALYPGKSFEEVASQRDIDPSAERMGRDWSESQALFSTLSDDMYDNGRHDRYYYDRQRNKVRVIHAEYRVLQRAYFVTDPSTGATEEVSKELAENLVAWQQRGALPPSLQATSTYRYRTYTAQFTGPELLFEGYDVEPFDGFSIVTFSYAVDSETGASYGMIRNLFDPQMEVNKAHSLSLENLSGQGKPGLIIEEGAVKSARTLEDQLRSSGSVAIVADGAVANGRFKERQVHQLSPGVSERLERGLAMVNRIAAVTTEDAGPAGASEAAATVQLRYRKSLIAMSDVIDSWEAFKRSVKKRVVQTIIKAMPTPQLAESLGNSSKYAVQGPAIIELGPDGQPRQMVQLDAVRSLRYDVRLDVSSDNATLRLMEGQSLLTLAQLQYPVDPGVMYRKLVVARSDREQLTTFAERSQAAQAQSASAEQQALQQQIQATVQIEMQKAMETARHNQVSEQLQAQKQAGDQATRIAAVLERAEANERQALLDAVAMIEARAERRAGGG